MKFTFDNVILFGDVHGELSVIFNYIKKYDLKNTCFISCGDFGVNVSTTKYAKSLEYYNKILKTNHIFVVRGNHDDPSYFTNKKVGNFLFIEDYTTLNINDKNFLFIGGAISIDRKPNPLFYNSSNTGKYNGRKLNYNYWLDENVKYLPEKLKDLTNIDIIVTHTAPSFCFPYQKNNLEDWFRYDPDLKSELEQERDILTNVYNDLKLNKLTHWFYGHFHNSNTSVHDGTQFILLNINEFYNI